MKVSEKKKKSRSGEGSSDLNMARRDGESLLIISTGLESPKDSSFLCCPMMEIPH